MAEVVTKGVGRVERTADRAEVQVSFEATGSTRAEAVDRLTGRVAALEPAFARPGVEVRSRQLTVNDNWDGSRRSGGRASQNYVVRVDDVTVLDELLATAVAAEPTWLGGPNWQLSDDAEAVAEAQGEAVADARRRAEGYARALGARLGPLQRLADGDAETQWAVESRAAVAGYGGSPGVPPQVDQLSLEAQRITVTVRCTATWALLD
ncbi:SIMPL domain-containing protein [Saccharothrix yanglingensis]|uniref:SIMPL domain-containing protein n=1 Tax=Saccharothrix yanglingensis TaxID=659496 RepID=A0ABU0WSX0_9PSEU|nr:SIMPL domain-containing protein [Saccharothrix yanglingensis]MDQ2582943.1 SIMPL domain-containing protein [Saccharothrix yanglingensis]